jgi:hypothetical protein
MPSMLRRMILKTLKRRLMWENLQLPLKEHFMYISFEFTLKLLTIYVRCVIVNFYKNS